MDLYVLEIAGFGFNHIVHAPAGGEGGGRRWVVWSTHLCLMFVLEIAGFGFARSLRLS